MATDAEGGGEWRAPGSFVQAQVARVAAPVLDVVLGALPDPGDVVGADLAHHLAGHAHDQGVVRNLLTLGNQGLGADQAVFPHSRAVEHDGADADQRVVFDRAPVQHGEVADRHVRAYGQGKARVGVQDAAVLNVGAFAHGDQLVVATQHYAPPDARVPLEPDLADHRSARRDPELVAGGRQPGVAQGVAHDPPPDRFEGILVALAGLGRGGMGERLQQALGLARSFAIYYGQPWRSRSLSRLYRPFVKAGDLVFDVGAHVGNHTRCFARLDARVVAIEPQAELVAWLRFQFRNEPGVTVLDCALAAAPGKA